MKNTMVVETGRRTTVEFHALGPVEAMVSGRTVDLGAPKQRTLLALLVSQAGRQVTTDVILEALWEGKPPPSAMTSLQVYVANLRKVLEPGRAPRTQATVLRTCARGYVLDADAVDVDVQRFIAHAEAGRQARDRDDPHQTLHECDAGLALWRGQAHAEVSAVPCVVPEVARLEELRLSTVEMRCAALLALGAHEAAVAELLAFVNANPLREYGCELLSLSLYRAGRQADALDVLRGIQTRLSEELGVDPTLRLQQLRQRILHQDPALDWRPAPAATSPRAAATSPSVAGTPSSADEPAVEVFVGRETAIRQLTEALAAAEAGRGQLVTPSGEPGAGRTRPLRRFSERSGVPVLWGTCADRIAVPPLSLRVLAQLARSVPESRCLLIAAYRSDDAPNPAGTLTSPTGAQPLHFELCTTSVPVREAVLRRVRQLPQPAPELLAVAAVAGRHFDAEVVSDVASIDIDTALAALDQAIAAGLIDEDEQRLGWFRFSDALVAEALYETTGRMRRGRLRLRIEAAAGRAWATAADTG
ncbi:BTAD domain-containing putative transcriptional regulator [Streptomyces paradoxus]|uniref:BTAD domain-containing putative transcriptional regulator n=1 Tax=Streptomyces paradoxus TaxID=66375 RepID=UPI0036414AC8